MWSRLGNKLSHQSAIQEAIKREYPRVLICEDDVVVAQTATVPAIETALGLLDSERPAWQLCLLGGAKYNRFARNTGNAPAGVDEIDCAECIYQSHAYLIKAEAYAELLQKWQSGLGADAGLVSLQRKSWAGRIPTSSHGTCGPC